MRGTFFAGPRPRQQGRSGAPCAQEEDAARRCVSRDETQEIFYEKPSEKATRERDEAIRRARKLARKKAQREGLIAAPKGKKVPPRRPTGWPPLAGAGGPPRLP